MGRSSAGHSVKQSPLSSGLPASLQTLVWWAWDPWGRGRSHLSYSFLQGGVGTFHLLPPSISPPFSSVALPCLFGLESLPTSGCHCHEGVAIIPKVGLIPRSPPRAGKGSRPPPQAHCSALPSVLPALACGTSGQTPAQIAGFTGRIGGQAQVSGERGQT